MATRSDVWEFYTKGENKATCMLCEKELYHPPNREQTTLDNFSAVCLESRVRRIANLIVNMVVLNIRPLQFVECDG